MKLKTGIMKFVVNIMVLVGVTVFTARAGAKDADAPLSVYVVNYPLQYFAERIGGPDVRVVFPAPADGDPAFWKPSPEQIAAYQYFIRRYSLNAQEVYWEPEESPTSEQWAELKEILKEHPAQWMIWEGTPNPATVDELKKSSLDSLTFDPCGNVAETGDYLSVMRDNALNLKKAFSR